MRANVTIQCKRVHYISINDTRSENFITIREYGVVMRSVASVCVTMCVCPVRALNF